MSLLGRYQNQIREHGLESVSASYLGDTEDASRYMLCEPPLLQGVCWRDRSSSADGLRVVPEADPDPVPTPACT